MITRPTFQKIALLFCSVIVTFIIIEFVVVRGLLGFNGFTPFYITEYDESLGWTLKKNFEGRWEWLEWDVYYKTNSQGFRDREHRLAKEKRRIIILGDSLAEGWGVGQNEIFANILAERLGGKFEVFNFSVRGYDIIQEYKCLSEIGLNYKPDIVIQVLSNNDYGLGQPSAAIRGRYLEFRPDYIIKDGKIIFEDTVEKPRIRWVKSPKIIACCVNILHKSAAFTYIKVLMRTFIYNAKKKLHIKHNQNKLLTDYDKNYKDAANIIYSNINQLKKRHKFEFVMITLWYGDDPSPELEEMTTRNQLLYLNLSRPREECYRYDTHPNPLGHQKIADQIIEFMTKENLL